MPATTVVSIAASCPTAPAGVRGYPVGTAAGPSLVAGGAWNVGPGVAAGVPPRAASGPTWSIGAEASWSRRAVPLATPALVVTELLAACVVASGGSASELSTP